PSRLRAVRARISASPGGPRGQAHEAPAPDRRRPPRAACAHRGAALGLARADRLARRRGGWRTRPRPGPDPRAAGRHRRPAARREGSRPMNAMNERMRSLQMNEDNRRWWALGAMCFALFMIMLDNTVVNVALPSIQRSLNASTSS